MGPTALNHGNIKSRAVEHATLGAEVILHIDDNHRSLGGIDRDRFGLGIEPDNPVVAISGREGHLGCLAERRPRHGGCDADCGGGLNEFAAIQFLHNTSLCRHQYTLCLGRNLITGISILAVRNAHCSTLRRCAYGQIYGPNSFTGCAVGKPWMWSAWSLSHLCLDHGRPGNCEKSDLRDCAWVP